MNDGWVSVRIDEATRTVRLSGGIRYRITVSRRCGWRGDRRNNHRPRLRSRKLPRAQASPGTQLETWPRDCDGLRSLSEAGVQAAVFLADVDDTGAVSSSEAAALRLCLGSEPAVQSDLEALEQLADRALQLAEEWRGDPELQRETELAERVRLAALDKRRAFFHAERQATWSSETAVVARSTAQDGTLVISKANGGRLRVDRSGNVELFDRSQERWLSWASVAEASCEDAESRGIPGMYTATYARRALGALRAQRESIASCAIQTGSFLSTVDDQRATDQVLAALDAAIAEASQRLADKDLLGTAVVTLQGIEALHGVSRDEADALASLNTRLDSAIVVAELTQKACIKIVGVTARSLWGPLGGAMAEGVLTGLTAIARGDYELFAFDVLTGALSGSGVIKSSGVKAVASGATKAIKEWSKRDQGFEEMSLADWKILLGVALAEGALSYAFSNIGKSVAAREGLQESVKNLFELLGADPPMVLALEEGLAGSLLKIFSSQTGKPAVKALGTWALEMLS